MGVSRQDGCRSGVCVRSSNTIAYNVKALQVVGPAVKWPVGNVNSANVALKFVYGVRTDISVSPRQKLEKAVLMSSSVEKRDALPNFTKFLSTFWLECKLC